MKVKRLAFVLFLAFLFPLQAQNDSGEWDDYDDEFFDDEILLMEGGELTIVGSKSTTQQMEIVDRETIEKTHAPDLPSLLEETLGLGVTRYGSYGNQADVNIRGFNTKRIAVLVDGIPVNSTASGDFDFNSVDPASIERIEVIHGSSDTKYNVSGALGGVINIVTVKKQKPGWTFGGGISNTSYLPGQYNKQYGGIGNPQSQDLADAQNVNVSGAYGAEKYSLKFNIFGNRAENHFLYQDDYGYARRKEGNEILDGGASASFLREFPNLAKFIAAGSFYLGNKHIPVSGYTVEYAEQRDLASRGNVMLEMPRAFHDDFSMELSLGHSWKRLTYKPGRETSQHDEHDLSLINRWNWFPASGITLRFGGDYSFIHLDSTNSGLHRGHRGGLYLSSEYYPVKKLLLIASIKGMADGSEIIPVPKFGLSWKVNDSVTLRNNYYRSFKFPDFNDLYWMQDGFMGNPNLKNEDGWGGDLGADFSVKDWLNINSTLYGQWADDSIHWNNASGSWRPENSGAAAFFGWDNQLKLVIPFSPGFLEKPILNLSWLLQLSWLLSGDLSFKDSVRIPYMPIHTFGVSLELPWKTSVKKLSGSLLVSGRFESSRYAETGNIIKLDPHFLLNLVYNQKLNKNLALYAKINNVLNTHYVSFADYPMPGISLTLGLRAEFGAKSNRNN